MKKVHIIGISALLSASFLLAHSSAFAGIAIGERIRMYNSQSVTTVHCVIDEIGRVESIWGPMKGRSYGVNLKVQSNGENLTVYLGPAWYIERQNFDIDNDDIVEVRGCKKMYNGKLVLVAQEIRKGPVTLKLRDNQGNPLWHSANTASASY